MNDHIRIILLDPAINQFLIMFWHGDKKGELKFARNNRSEVYNFFCLYSAVLELLLDFIFNMGDIDTFLNKLNTVTKNTNDETIATRFLTYFEQIISANLFCGLRNNSINQAFIDIWKVLFSLSVSEITSIKLESSRATSIFLTRLLPFYNEFLQKSLSKVIEEIKYRSPLIPASFVFLSKFVSQPLLLQYTNITPIIDQFYINDSCFPFIIDNMGMLGDGVLQYLLKKLLIQLNNDPNRHLIRSIGSLIGHDIQFFLPAILKLNELSLFAYIFTNLEFDYKQFDISHVVDLVKTTLETPTSTPLERDCAYQIISVLNPTITEINSLINITFCETTVMVDPAKNLDRPPFFLLPLPISLLYPKENESVLILTSKFKTLAKSVSQENVTEILSIFDRYFSLEHNETVSAAILGFASQPNLLQSPELINKVIYSNPISWFHSYDILRVIKSFFIINEHTLHILHECLISGNVRLSNESVNVFKELINDANSEQIHKFLYDQIDLFDFNTLERILFTLKITSKKVTSQLYLIMISNLLLENILLYIDDIPMLTVIFDFLSEIDLSKIQNKHLNQSCQIAMAISHSYFSSIYGDFVDAENNYTAFKSKDATLNINFKDYLAFACNDVCSKSFDILNEMMSITELFPAFSNSVRYLLKLPIFVIGIPQSADFASQIFNFFPSEASTFIEDNWANFDDATHNNLLQSLFLKLSFIPDAETIATWCRIFLKTPNAISNPQINKTQKSLDFTCATLLTPYLTKMKCAADFLAYLSMSIKDKNDRNAVVFISPLSNDQKFTIYEEMLKIYEGKIPEFFMNLLPKHKETNQLKDISQPRQILNQSTGFIADMNRAILHGNVYEVITIIQNGLNNEFTLFDFSFSPKMKKEISCWISNHLQPDVINKLVSNKSLFDLLCLIRTEWMPLIISFFKNNEKNQIDLLNQISNSPKVKYQTILNLSTISAFVPFNNQQLFHLASTIAMTSQKIKKMRSSFLFLAHTLSIINKTNKNGYFKSATYKILSINVNHLHPIHKQTKFIVDSSFPQHFANHINPYFESLPHRETAFCLSELTKNVSDINTVFLFFCRKLLLASSPYFAETGLLGSILIANESELVKTNKSLAIDYMSLVSKMLSFFDSENKNLSKNTQNVDISEEAHSKKFMPKLFTSNDSPKDEDKKKKSSSSPLSEVTTSPSVFLSVCKIISSIKIFKDSLNPIMNAFQYWHHLPFVNKMIIKTITRDIWHERFRWMKVFYSTIKPHNGEFHCMLKFSAFVLSSPNLQKNNQKDEMCLKSFSVFSQTLQNPTNIRLLNTALYCFIARLNFVCTNNNDSGQTMVSEDFLEWLNNLKKNDGPLTMFFAFAFVKVLEMKMNAKYFFTLITDQLIKCAPRFFTVFPVIAKYFLKYKKCSWSVESLKSTAIFSECHKKAIDALIQGNIDLALKLAMFDKDCDESAALICQMNST